MNYLTRDQNTKITAEETYCFVIEVQKVCNFVLRRIADIYQVLLEESNLQQESKISSYVLRKYGRKLQ